MSEEGGVVIELTPEQAEAFENVAELWQQDSVLSEAPEGVVEPPLEELLSSKAPVEVRNVDGQNLSAFAKRRIQKGEVIFSEEATAYFLSRSGGFDKVFALESDGKYIAVLPDIINLKLLRDTLTFNPKYAGNYEAAYRRIIQLSAYGSRNHEPWNDIDEVSPFLDPNSVTEDDRIPRRVQLLNAISSCNTFATHLPEDDNDPWKLSFIWPTLGRIPNPDVREALFEDEHPLSTLSSFFPESAMFNHSCDSNMESDGIFWDGSTPAPVFTLKAACDIEEGEELTLSYSFASSPDDSASDPSTTSVDERRRRLLMQYRFRCLCKKCCEELPVLKRSIEEEDPSLDPLSEHFPYGMGIDSIFHVYLLKKNS